MPVTASKLRWFPLFAKVEDEALNEIASLMNVYSVPADNIIVMQGDPCEAVYFIVKGMVRLRRISLEGREFALRYLGPGKCFDLITVLDGGPHLATADAITDVRLYTLPCRDFRRIISQHREIMEALLELLAAEVRRLTEVAEEMALHSVRTRLARFLLAHADGSETPKRWTQEEIASQIGTVREMVGRILRDFASAGLIRREQGRIILVNRKGLEEEALGNRRR